MNTDTIAAIATAISNSGIGIIRISGDEAFQVADKIFCPQKKFIKVSEMKSHTIHYGYIKDGEETIDEVLLMVMKAPNTYTRENTVEINCHGGIIVVKKILETVFKYGARPAEPGEFTKRAFLSGRIDLSQAESVIDIINAKNEMALKSSVSQLRGSVSNIISEIRSQVLEEIARIESALDDPEHMDLNDYPEKLRAIMLSLQEKLLKLLKTSDNGKMLKEGINTVIVGKPNAGKSSLMNLFVGEDKAIVTDIAGTTRDILEEQIQIAGIGLNIIDTAGIRETDDVIEKIGVLKAKEHMENADLVIYVVDSSTDLDNNDLVIMDTIQDKNVIVLLNKSDLEVVTTADSIREYLDKKIIAVSALENIGISEFEDTIESMFFDGKISFNEEIYITNIRHKQALADAEESISMVLDSIENGMPEDFYTIDMMNAYEKLGSIIGESIGEDLVNEIFSKFCMGK